MTPIALVGLSKSFGATIAVRHVDLTIEPGELFFLLGPSGCGKTTLLRMIAGFIEPTAGSIRFGDRDVTATPPNRRNCGMVFQSYALWPHLTVAENVGYGLRVRKVGGSRLNDRVNQALRLVQMQDYAERKPNQLSGGQQQRVALARALVIEPTVLLLDEPLSNLDAKLRLQMRAEIRRICKQTGITSVYVTHDQKEALSMADRLAVMRNGGIDQVGPPHLLYQRPVSRFVADFLGETNFLSAVVRAVEGESLVLETAAGLLRTKRDTTPASNGQAPAPGTRVTCSIRPEAIRIASTGDNTLSTQLLGSVYLGDTVQHQARLTDGTIIRLTELNPKPTRQPNQPGGLSTITIDAEDVVIVKD